MTLFKNDDDSVPSVKAVAAYVDSNISGAMDFTAVKDTSANTVSITNETDGLCAVRLTNMSSGNVQYQSNISLGAPSNKKTAFTFSITSGVNYMIEAWYFDSANDKLVPAVVRYA